MNRRHALGILALAGAGLLTGCGVSSASFRYRMTVEGQHHGTAVYELLAEKVNGLRLADEKPGGAIIKGQALVIETETGPVFVLLHAIGGGDDRPGEVIRTLAPDIPWNGQPNFWKAVNHLGGWFGGAKGELPRAEWPTMVRFRDLSDPKSVEKVEPETLGITHIWLETTSDLVTTGVEKRLVWFDQYVNRFLNGATMSYEDLSATHISSHLSSRSFSTDVDK
jgi:hypothetical protein